MPSRIIRTKDDLRDFTRLLDGVKLPVTVSWAAGADRSTEQNRTNFRLPTFTRF